MDPLIVVLVTLAAVLVGAIVPAVVQWMLTLSEARRLMRRIGPIVERTATESEQAAKRVNRLAGKAEKELERTRGFFDAVEGLTQSVQSLRESAKVSAAIGAAVGPAIAAAIRAMANRGDGTRDDSTAADDASAAAADEVLREFTSKLESKEKEQSAERPKGDGPSRGPGRVPPKPGVHS